MANRLTCTRDEIMHMLKVKGPLAVGDIAQELGITEMAVRRHLNTLERDNLIKSTLVRQTMGRPTNVYSLTKEADELFPRNYLDLALDFLHDILETEGSDKVEELFRRREKRLEQKYRPYVQGDLEARVAALAELQNQRGYMVQWEKDEATGTYCIREYNCPIAQVAEHFQQACSCEQSLFRSVLDAEVVQTACKARGEEHCVFEIRERSRKQA